MASDVPAAEPEPDDQPYEAPTLTVLGEVGEITQTVQPSVTY